MFKRSYLVLLLAAVLGIAASLVYGSASATNDQKEKEKAISKDKQGEKEKDQKVKAEKDAMFDASAFQVVVAGGSYLGVYLEEVTAERMKEMGLSEERGAIVMEVAAGSPAEKAGLKANDVIVSFNNRPVESVRELQRILGETPSDRTVPLEIMRSGNRQTLSATLTKPESPFPGLMRKMPEGEWRFNEQQNRDLDRVMRESQEAMRQAQKELEQLSKQKLELGEFNFNGPMLFQNFRGTRLGISVETMGDQLSQFFGVKEGRGLLVSEVNENSAAAKAGLKAGDVITAVDGQKVDGLETLLAALRSKEEGMLTLTILRNREEQTITVTLEKPEPRRLLPRRKVGTTT